MVTLLFSNMTFNLFCDETVHWQKLTRYKVDSLELLGQGNKGGLEEGHFIRDVTRQKDDVILELVKGQVFQPLEVVRVVDVEVGYREDTSHGDVGSWSMTSGEWLQRKGGCLEFVYPLFWSWVEAINGCLMGSNADSRKGETCDCGSVHGGGLEGTKLRW